MFIAVVTGIAGWEWARLSGMTAATACALWGLSFAAVVAVGGLAAFGPDGRLTETARQIMLVVYGLAALFWLVLVPCWFKRRWAMPAGSLALALGMVVLVPAAFALVQLRSLGGWWLLAAMAIVWVSDIAAYFVGRALGRHKLAPTISPGKTWEGVGGAILGVLIYCVILGAASGALMGVGVGTLAIWAAVVVVITGAGIAGDLFESMLKRQVGAKDSSQLLPGHGGVLDRIDSLTSCMPLIALLTMMSAFGG